MNKDLGLIGRYELQRPLGRGSLAEVWKIFDYQVFRPRGSDNLKAYIVMNYVKGRTLADYIRHTSRAGQFPSAADMVHLFMAAGVAIDYAHQHGVIHADIKPSNILLDKQYLLRNPMGEPKLTDFGIAKMFATNTGKFNSQFSTPLYIAPEQALHYPAGNELSDIYTLGVILYEICTGKLPFEGESASDIMEHLISSMPPAPASINPNISQAASDVILRSLAKDPAERFASASAMMRALAHALALPIPGNLGWFISLPDHNGVSPVLDPPTQSERADLDTSTASLASMDEPAEQKAPWSSPANWWSSRKSQQSAVEQPTSVLALEPPAAPSGKSQQPAVEKPTPAPKLPRAPRSRKLGSFRSIVRKQAAEKLVSVLQKHRPTSARSMAGRVHNVPV